MWRGVTVGVVGERRARLIRPDPAHLPVRRERGLGRGRCGPGAPTHSNRYHAAVTPALDSNPQRNGRKPTQLPLIPKNSRSGNSREAKADLAEDVSDGDPRIEIDTGLLPVGVRRHLVVTDEEGEVAAGLGSSRSRLWLSWRG